MAAEIEDRRSVAWGLWLFLIGMLLLAVLVPPAWLAGLTETERRLNIGQIGLESALWVEETGHGWYRTAIVSSGVEGAVRGFLIPSSAQRASSKGLEDFGYSIWFPYVEARLDAIEIALKRVFSRWAMWLLWLPAVPLVIVPMLVDGLMCWRKRQYTFAYASPVIHGWSGKVLTGLLLLSVTVTLLPVPVPAFVMPAALFMAGCALNRLLAHLQKRI